MPIPPTETWYCWRVLVTFADETPRLLVPWGDPHVYEYPFDFLYSTPDEARAAKQDQAPDEDWILCVETLAPVV